MAEQKICLSSKNKQQIAAFKFGEDNSQILTHIKPHTGIPQCYSQVCNKSVDSAFPFKLLCISYIL